MYNILTLKEFILESQKEIVYSKELDKEIEDILIKHKLNNKYTLYTIDNIDKKNIWKEICIKYDYLTEDFIRKFQDKVYWRYVSLNSNLSLDFLREFKNSIDWNNASRVNNKWPESFIREFKDRVNWYYISFNELSEDFIREFKDRVDWNVISRTQRTLSEDFIREFKNKVNWVEISGHQEKLSPEFCWEFRDKIDWGELHRFLGYTKEYCEKQYNLKHNIIVKNKWEKESNTGSIHYNDIDVIILKMLIKYNLSSQYNVLTFKNMNNTKIWNDISSTPGLELNFIDEFQDKVNWDKISQYQKLPEFFIIKFHDRVNWSIICIYQEMTKSLIKKFKYKIDWRTISSNKSLTEDIIRIYLNKFDWVVLSGFQRLSPEFCWEFKDKIFWEELYYNLGYTKEYCEKMYILKIKTEDKFYKDNRKMDLF